MDDKHKNLPSSLPYRDDGNAQKIYSQNPPPIELKRALAVQISQHGQSYRTIHDILQVSLGFISASCQRYERSGIQGLRSNYWGTAGYLSAEQKQELFRWLDGHWTLEEVIDPLRIATEWCISHSRVTMPC